MKRTLIMLALVVMMHPPRREPARPARIEERKQHTTPTQQATWGSIKAKFRK